MGHDLVGDLMKWTANKLSSLLPSPISASTSESSINALEDMKQLERTMKRIQSLLVVAADRHIRDHCENFRLEELKEVAYDAEDLVEEYAYDVLHAKIQFREKLGEDVNTDLSSIDVSVPVPEEMALRAKGIRERFDEIIGEWEKLRWMENDGVRQVGFDIVANPPTSSLVHEPNIYGRHQDKDNIIALLLNGDGVKGGNKDGNLCVLPIVGMGGVGKTTLAQLVYNDPAVNLHFDMKAWVCASKEFDVEVLTGFIISSLTKTPRRQLQLDSLQRILKEKITGQRFLLVLDDVWNENIALWHLLRAPLYHSPLSKILVTARNERVAKIMQTIPFYPLSCLDQEYSWELFKQVAFENQDPRESNNLLEIGRKITVKCQGLPLAIKAIGCALSFELEAAAWRDTLESELWELDAGVNEVLPALQVSYDRMPAHLKQCFFSLSLFPKNYVFFKECTIMFWSALGFLKPEGKRSAENSGCRYFDDIQQRSMLQQIQYDEKTCGFVMHDLVQNLAEFVAGDAFRRLDTEIFDSIPTRARYLSVLVNSLPNVIDFTSIRPSSSLRALQIFNTISVWLCKDICIKLNEELFHNLRSLRILNFSNTGIKTLPDSIGKLKQLHFLGLANTKIEVLPESICFLYNLQTLDLLGCPLQELPKGTKNLVNLQHLIVENWSNIHLPHGIGHLTNLETLPVFNIERGSGCEISELSKLNKLCGELRITGLDYIRQHDEQGVPADLIKKKNICTLILDWCSHEVSKNGSYSPKEVPVGNHEVVLAVLQPQINIEMLKLYHFPGLSFPRWLGDPSYSRLVEVVLFGNSEKGSKFLPTLGLLPSLKTLSIQCMLTVEYAGYEFRGHDTRFKAYPSLDKLEFKYMPKWVQWFGVEYHDFSSLKTLKMVDCFALRFMPNYLSLSLRKLVLSSCKELIYLPTMLLSLANLILMGDINKLFLLNLDLPSLTSLEIGFSENIKSIELGYNNLPSLKELFIKCCKNVSYFSGFDGLLALRGLQLDGCRSLHIHEPIPPSLQVLKVTNCPGLCDWELYQRKTFGHQLQRRGTDRDDSLEAFPDEDISKGKDYNNAYEEVILADDYGKTLDFNDEMNFKVPLLAVPISGDDYNLDWLLSVSQNSRKYNDKDQLPSCYYHPVAGNGSVMDQRKRLTLSQGAEKVSQKVAIKLLMLTSEVKTVPTTKFMTRVSSKPTNRSRYTGRVSYSCRCPLCSDKSQGKAKRTHKFHHYTDVAVNHLLVGSANQAHWVQFDLGSANWLLSQLTDDLDIDCDDEFDEDYEIMYLDDFEAGGNHDENGLNFGEKEEEEVDLGFYFVEFVRESDGDGEDMDGWCFIGEI